MPPFFPFTNEKGKGYFPSEGKKKITDPKSLGQIQTQVASLLLNYDSWGAWKQMLCWDNRNSDSK